MSYPRTLTVDQRQLLAQNAHRKVRAIIAVENSALAYLVYDLAAGGAADHSPESWGAVLDALQHDERTLGEWMLDAALVGS